MSHKSTLTIPLNRKVLPGEVILFDRSMDAWLLFQNPLEIVSANSVSEVKEKLERVEILTQQQGFHAAGFISYEASPAFDNALRVNSNNQFPLLWFAVYEEAIPVIFTETETADVKSESQWTPGVTQSEYDRAIDCIKKHIAEGDTYQVNYTFKLHKGMDENGFRLFMDLARSQGNGYPAYINTGEYVICSVSPELFFSMDGDRIITRPMKGTASRGRSIKEDREKAEWLQKSEKNRAENLMIVDMIRNDLGKVAKTGSVQVDHLFDVEKYPTVWQMTSTVSAKSVATISEIITALFPCASITGAPKANTMKIISELESSPRNIYTGSIGYIRPGRKIQFNVAIRTILIDIKHSIAEYGVGGGIVWDSGKADEYEECKVKARVLSDRRPEFSLLETMLWTPQEGYVLLDEHMQRLNDSAAYFDYPLNPVLVHSQLTQLVLDADNSDYRVRLLLAPDGSVSLQKYQLDLSSSDYVRLALAVEPVRSDNIFLYHKTTNRAVYDYARSLVQQECDDILLWNEQGEITESTIANVVVQIDGKLYTPPVSCGLLAGTFRQSLIQQGRVQEMVIPVSRLKDCEKIFLVNSVRLCREVEIIDGIEPT